MAVVPAVTDTLAVREGFRTHLPHIPISSPGLPPTRLECSTCTRRKRFPASVDIIDEARADRGIEEFKAAALASGRTALPAVREQARIPAQVVRRRSITSHCRQWCLLHRRGLGGGDLFRCLPTELLL